LANDKLGSVSGKAPMMDETRAEFRAIALNRGVGWRQQDFYLVSAIQLLYITEYASWNSQSMIGMGRTELSGGTWVKDSYIGVTGKSNGSGNATANTVGILMMPTCLTEESRTSTAISGSGLMDST